MPIDDNPLEDGDALIVVDVQNDFCPGGALPIEHGDTVVPVINRWIAAAVAKGVPVYASRDWHPVGLSVSRSAMDLGRLTVSRIAMAPDFTPISSCPSPPSW